MKKTRVAALLRETKVELIAGEALLAQKKSANEIFLLCVISCGGH